jgi:hypothetical protein
MVPAPTKALPMQTQSHPDLNCFLPQESSKTARDPNPAIDRLVEQIQSELAQRQQEESRQRQRLFDQD